MSKANEPAFPTRERHKNRVGNAYEIPVSGLTKREYFAAMAMQPLVGNFKADSMGDPTLVASGAVKHADALLAELEKSHE